MTSVYEAVKLTNNILVICIKKWFRVRADFQSTIETVYRTFLA